MTRKRTPHAANRRPTISIRGDSKQQPVLTGLTSGGPFSTSITLAMARFSQAAWKKQDPPPHRVKPLPVQVIRRMASLAGLS